MCTAMQTIDQQKTLEAEARAEYAALVSSEAKGEGGNPQRVFELRSILSVVAEMHGDNV